MKYLTGALSDWAGGGITELAEAVANTLDAMGKKDDTLASAKDLGKRIRVIRDYAQRGILGDAERRGKELHYRQGHLNQLVAARLLAREGVSLSAIASQFQQDPDVVVMTLGTVPDDNTALSTWQAIRDRDRSLGKSSAPATSPTTHTWFMRSAGEDRGRRVNLRQLLDRLGVHKRFPRTSDATRIDVTEWCSVLLDTQKLRELSRGEIDDLGRVISASLLKARSGK